MKLNLRLLAVIFVVLLVIFLVNAVIGIGEALPLASQEPEKIVKRQILPEFDETEQAERIKQISTVGNEIETLLEKLIEKDATREDQSLAEFQDALKVLNEAGKKVPAEIKNKVEKIYQWKKTSTTTTTTTTTTTKSTTTTTSTTTTPKAQLTTPDAKKVMDEKLAQITTKKPEPFEPILFPGEKYESLIEKLNKKRKFLYDERNRNEEKRVNAEKTKMRQYLDKVNKINKINSEIRDPESYEPGKPPMAGSRWDANQKKWVIPALPTPASGGTTTTTPNPLSGPELEKIRSEIDMRNGQVATGEYSKGAGRHFEHIYLIQVHSRTEFLKFLLNTITSQKEVNSENHLLVISHDIWNEDMNRVTDVYNHIPTVNIFFPKSTLFFRNEFPATDPNDCLVKEGKIAAKGRNCNNWQWSDTFGNYREAHIVNIKHHWWWKLNFVAQFFSFDHLVLLEEDHALTSDALHVMELMENLPNDSDLMALGHYKANLKLSPQVTKMPPDMINAMPWFSGMHNMAMAVSKKWVDLVLGMSEDFCIYDDYNWDWTLFHLSTEVVKPERGSPWQVLVPEMPRSQHLGGGGCGVHHMKGGCNFDMIRKNFESDQSKLTASGKMFPSTLRVQVPKKRSTAPITRNGGWGDLRDVLLCKSITINALNIDMSWLEDL